MHGCRSRDDCLEGERCANLSESAACAPECRDNSDCTEETICVARDEPPGSPKPVDIKVCLWHQPQCSLLARGLAPAAALCFDEEAMGYTIEVRAGPRALPGVPAYQPAAVSRSGGLVSTRLNRSRELEVELAYDAEEPEVRGALLELVKAAGDQGWELYDPQLGKVVDILCLEEVVERYRTYRGLADDVRGVGSPTTSSETTARFKPATALILLAILGFVILVAAVGAWTLAR